MVGVTIYTSGWMKKRLAALLTPLTVIVVVPYTCVSTVHAAVHDPYSLAAAC